MAERKGVRLLSLKELFQKGKSDLKSLEDFQDISQSKDISGVIFKKQPRCTRQKIGVVTLACLLVTVGAVVAVYFAITGSDNKDMSSEKENQSPVNNMPPSTSPSTKTQTSPLSATESPTELRKTTESPTTTIGQKTTTEDTSVGLGEWGEWTSCTATCGSGIHKRYRECSSETQTCSGDFVETRVCTMKKCPVHGIWTTWSSWDSCDVTCGGGLQIRSRTCKKQNEQDFDCVGRQSQNQSCNVFQCPDCNRKCTTGTLNEACDACICEEGTTNGRVVSAKTGNPIAGAAIYDAEAALRVLTRSNSTGFFTLNSTCTTTKLLVTSDGFVNKEIMEIGTYVVIRLDRLVLPYFTETPESKNRIQGENVTLCCAAKANPPILSYEWFKDGLLLNETFLPNRTSLTLFSVSVEDSGRYQCRANSLSYSAIMSPVAAVKITESSKEFCSDALKEKIISLPNDCHQPLTNSPTYKVRECIKNSCRQNGSLDGGTCRDQVESCCSALTSQLKTVNCSGYQIEVVDVTACGCNKCGSNIITVSGNVKGKKDMLPIAGAEVWFNGDLMTSTNYKGTFRVRFSKVTERIVINVQDTSKRYLEAIKVINIKSKLTGTLSVNINLLKANDPVEIDSTVENTIKAGTLVNNNSVSRFELSIPANTYYLPNGTIYNGTVCACLTFIDPSNSSYDEDIPGNFQFIGTMGEPVRLDSLSVFSLFFEDNSGNDIHIKDPIDVSIPYELGANQTSERFQLWTLSAETGFWVLNANTGENERRKRREEKSSSWIGEIDLSKIRQKWINIDRVQSDGNVCFFKLKLYTDSNCTEEIERLNDVDVDVHMLIGSVLYSDKVFVQNTATECVPTVCRENLKDNSAYISAFYLGYWGLVALYAAKPVTPSGLKYTIAESDQDKTLKIEMSRTESGPFFKEESKCKADPKYYLRYYEKRDIQLSEFTTQKYPVVSGSITDETLSLNQKAWYNKDLWGSFNMCMIKVRIEQRRYTENSFILRVISSGGSIEATKGTIFGIRDHLVDFRSDAENFCLEYKCSSRVPTEHNGQYFTDFAIDFVNVTVIPMMSAGRRGDCFISFISDRLIKENTTENIKNQLYAKKFEVFAPKHSSVSSDHGLYYEDICQNDECTEENEIKTRDILKHKCMTGEDDDNDENIEDISVLFKCRIW